MKLEPLAAFTVKLSTESGSIRIFVWRTLKDLRSHARNETSMTHTGRIYGYCHTYDRFYKSGRRAADFAEVHLAAKYLGVSVLSHELAHAALAWAQRTKIDDLIADTENPAVSDAEERFCYVLGDLMAEVVTKLYELKILT
jgi:hypothetical protein